MLIRVVIDPVDDGDLENFQVTVLADATMTVPAVLKILELALHTINSTIPILSVGTIESLLNSETDRKKQN